MTREGEGKIFSSGEARTLFLSIPSHMVTNSVFPFEEGENVLVRVEDEKLIVEGLKDDPEEEKRTEETEGNL